MNVSELPSHMVRCYMTGRRAVWEQAPTEVPFHGYVGYQYPEGQSAVDQHSGRTEKVVLKGRKFLTWEAAVEWARKSP